MAAAGDVEVLCVLARARGSYAASPKGCPQDTAANRACGFGRGIRCLGVVDAGYSAHEEPCEACDGSSTADIVVASHGSMV